MRRERINAIPDGKSVGKDDVDTINTFVGAIVVEELVRVGSGSARLARRYSLRRLRGTREADGHPGRHQTRRRDSLFTRYRNFIPSPSIVVAAPPYEPSPSSFSAHPIRACYRGVSAPFVSTIHRCTCWRFRLTAQNPFGPSPGIRYRFISLLSLCDSLLISFPT